MKARVRAYCGVLLSFGLLPIPLGTAGAEGARAVDEIVVTARKREESLQDSPVPVTVISRSGIENLGIESMDDLVSAVPGLIIGEHSGASGGSIYLRGVGSGETNPLIEQAIATNVDSVLAGSGQIRRAAMMDVERIEVLRGPQALFFGKNSPGGVISIITADPGDEFEAKLRFSRELEAAENVVEGVVSGPIGGGFGARVAASYLKSDGYFDVQQFDVTDPAFIPFGGGTPFGETEYPGTEEVFVRGTLLWDGSDRTTVRAKFTYADSDHNVGSGTSVQRIDCPLGAPQGQPVAFECEANGTVQSAGVPATTILLDPTATNTDPNGFRDNEQLLGSLEINHDLTDSLTITSISAYYQVEDALSTSFALGPVNTISSSNNTFRMDQISQELRLVSDFDFPFNFMLGAYYETRDSATGTSATVFNAAFLGREVFEQEQSAYSFAAQAIWNPIDPVEITVGGRYSKEKKEIEVTFNGAMVPLSDNDEDWSNFSPEVTVSYRPVDELTLYASYKEGFKSGGFDASFGAAARDGASYDQETVDGFEIGAKALLLGRSLRIDAVGYYYDYEGLQVAVFDSATTSLQILNADGAKIRGFELDFVWDTELEGLSVFGGYAYNDTEYDTFLTGCFAGQTIALGCNAGFNPGTGAFTAQDAGGEPLVFAPESVANLGLEYGFPISDDWRVNALANWRYMGSYSARAGGPASSRQDSSSKFDATLSLSSERFTLSVKGRNLSNEYTLLRTVDTPLTGAGTGTAVGVLGDQAANVSRGREVLLQGVIRY